MNSTPQLTFSQMTDEQIVRVCAENKIALTPNEARQVEALLGRAPTLTEAIIWGIQGSEHCSYKSTRQHLKTLPTKSPNVMVGVGEDAGIVEFATDNQGRKYGIIMGHESHNHPSQVVPYEGAATGIGGLVRDIIVMGGRPIATADPLRFGQPDRTFTKTLANDVISGIAGYGNPLGVPNLAGDVYFDDSFNDNCLVNVVALGALREDEIIHSFVPEYAEGYDIIVVGKPTDNSGMGGAAFSSLTLDEEDKEANKGAVQEPNPFLERHLLESTLGLFRKLKEAKALDKVAFKDMGAGGITCATVELVEAGGFGAEIDLSQVHVAMDGLHPSVIACAETQERLCWMCDPSLTEMILDHYNKEWDLPTVSLGARASKVGKVKKGNYTVRYGSELLVDARPEDITKGVLVDRPYHAPQRTFSEPNFEIPNLQELALKVLGSENVASRLPIFEQYDKVVQGQTVFQPGMADAGLLVPFRHRDEAPEIHKVGAALSVDSNPRHGLIDPYWGAVNAVVESMRNVAAIGATPWIATDCLNFGSPEKPEQMWEIVEAVRGIKDALEGVGHLAFPGPLAILGGNVSLYNESKNHSVAPSPVIGMLGRIDNVDKAVTMEVKTPGSSLFLIGKRKDELGGSEYYRQLGHLGANLPKPDFAQVREELKTVIAGIDQGLISAAHDISDGGLFVAVAEMLCGGRGVGRYGASVDLAQVGDLRIDKELFSETGGFVVEVKDAEAFAKLAPQAVFLGKVTEKPQLIITDAGAPVLNFPLAELKETWLTSLRNLLNS
jgi:phosphoribosylformylglycinamidine synthase II